MIIKWSSQVRRRWKREIWSAEGSLYLYSALRSGASALFGDDQSVEVERHVDVAHNRHRLIDAACILQLERAFAPRLPSDHQNQLRHGLSGRRFTVDAAEYLPHFQAPVECSGSTFSDSNNLGTAIHGDKVDTNATTAMTLDRDREERGGW
jgi:hypothetical protein